MIFLPKSLINEVLQEAYGHLLTGHDGIYKTKERIFQCYYWPGMDASIADHLQTCTKCQLGCTDHRPPPALLTPLPQPTEPNMRIHADLFGPLRDMGRNKKYILTITDAFTKYVELVALPNKEAPTVCEAIFNRWICRYSVPIEIVTDQGGEFCNELSAELYKLLQTSHLHTSSRHPACNSQAEVANKTIAKYLRNLVRDDTLDWEQYLCPLMFSYNTSFHRSIKTTPFFITFGIKPRLPTFPGPDLRRKFYDESTSAELHQIYARDIARRNNKNSTEESEEDFNKRAQPHNYQVQQLVLLDEHSFLHKNTKLAPKWSGPHCILRLKGPVNVELLLNDKKKHLLVHVNRIKPYFVPEKSKIDFNEENQQRQIPPPPSQSVPVDRQLRPETPMSLLQPTQMPPPPTPSIHRFPQPQRDYSPPPPPITQPMPAPSPPLLQQQQQQVTQRKRGRPQKSTEFAPELPAAQVPYDLRSRSQVQQTILPEKPALPRSIVPHFTFAAPPTQEGGGSEEQNAIDALKNKKRKKKSSEACKQIQ